MLDILFKLSKNTCIAMIEKKKVCLMHKVNNKYIIIICVNLSQANVLIWELQTEKTIKKLNFIHIE